MSKSALKKHQDLVGGTSQGVLFAVPPAVPPAIPFPGVYTRSRVIIERPAADPVRRICPNCGASFDDYTGKPNTVYCRPYCKKRMSGIKHDTALNLLETMPLMDHRTVMELDGIGGLPHLEKLLNSFGYTFSRDAKEWVKHD